MNSTIRQFIGMVFSAARAWLQSITAAAATQNAINLSFIVRALPN
jgi:hypothetical protein